MAYTFGRTVPPAPTNPFRSVAGNTLAGGAALRPIANQAAGLPSLFTHGGTAHSGAANSDPGAMALHPLIVNPFANVNNGRVAAPMAGVPAAPGFMGGGAGAAGGGFEARTTPQDLEVQAARSSVANRIHASPDPSKAALNANPLMGQLPAGAAANSAAHPSWGGVEAAMAANHPLLPGGLPGQASTQDALPGQPATSQEAGWLAHPDPMVMRAYGGMAMHRAIVGDPQSDGGPNPELVESAGPIKVTPLRNFGNLPRYAYGTEDSDAGVALAQKDIDSHAGEYPDDSPNYVKNERDFAGSPNVPAAGATPTSGNPPPAPPQGYQMTASPEQPAAETTAPPPAPSTGFNPQSATDNLMAGLFGPPTEVAAGQYGGTPPTPYKQSVPAAPNPDLVARMTAMENRQSDTDRTAKIAQDVADKLNNAPKLNLTPTDNPLAIYEIAMRRGHTEGVPDNDVEAWNRLPPSQRRDLIDSYRQNPMAFSQHVAGMQSELAMARNQMAVGMWKEGNKISNEAAIRAETARHNTLTKEHQDRQDTERERLNNIRQNHMDYNDRAKADKAKQDFEDKQRALDDTHRSVDAEFAAAQKKGDVDGMRELNAIKQDREPKTAQAALKLYYERHPAEKKLAEPKFYTDPETGRRFAQGEKLSQSGSISESQGKMTQAQAATQLAHTRDHIQKLKDNNAEPERINQAIKEQDYLQKLVYPGIYGEAEKSGSPLTDKIKQANAMTH